MLYFANGSETKRNKLSGLGLSSFTPFICFGAGSSLSMPRAICRLVLAPTLLMYTKRVIRFHARSPHRNVTKYYRYYSQQHTVLSSNLVLCCSTTALLAYMSDCSSHTVRQCSPLTSFSPAENSRMEVITPNTPCSNKTCTIDCNPNSMILKIQCLNTLKLQKLASIYTYPKTCPLLMV